MLKFLFPLIFFKFNIINFYMNEFWACILQGGNICVKKSNKTNPPPPWWLVVFLWTLQLCFWETSLLLLIYPFVTHVKNLIVCVCEESKQINALISKNHWKMLKLARYFGSSIRLERHQLRCFSTEPKAYENAEKEKKFKILELEIDVRNKMCI